MAKTENTTEKKTTQATKGKFRYRIKGYTIDEEINIVCDTIEELKVAREAACQLLCKVPFK